MKKLVVLGMGLCMALAFTSCKSSESAYKKAYEKAKQQELAEASVAEEAPAAAPVVAAPVATTQAAPVEVGTVREEKVQLVSGAGLKAYSVVCGSFGVKANADGLKSKLDADGYNAKVVFNADRNMYRVIVSSFDDRVQAAQARDNFKAKYASNPDFQKSWLLYAK
jgi:cell division protein FtsN